MNLSKFNIFSGIILLTLSAVLSGGCQTGNQELDNLHKICIKASEEKIGKHRNVEKYCDCAVPYIYDFFKDDKDKMEKFADGDFDQINNTTDADFVSYLDNCVLENIDFNPSSMEKFITAEKEESIRWSVAYEMDEQFKATHDVEEFCDCYMEKIKQFSMEEFNHPKIVETEKYKNMMASCGERSLKNQ